MAFTRALAVLIITLLWPPSVSAQSEFEVSDPCTAPFPVFNFNLSQGYQERNAYLALWASFLVEHESRDTIVSTLAKWGFSDVLLVGKPRKGAIGYLAEGENYRLLSLRGTTSVIETLQDVRFASTPMLDIGLPGRGHTGFISIFKQIWNEIESPLKIREARESKPLVIVGHSMGGAEALMLAMKLQADGFYIQSIYTSAQPRVGDDVFYQDVETKLGSRYFRLENPEDFVPKVPPSASADHDFAAALFADGTAGYSSIKNLIKNLAYGVPRGLKVELRDTLIHKRDEDLHDERSFWSDIHTELNAGEGLDPIFQVINRQGSLHKPQAYICHFLDRMLSH